ncbi:TetR family transcriptional regulator [Amorphoplanes nipponensis]|uniref:TetR family transcriptional regulator n=1 Tax=Actinoplanes nipponensis TaxID=135950 RepID=A0A919JFJ5_9ACTN|nr:TetR family transcriptional regulator [Actinoplanes nipponensis]GIE49541.1 TetR family transcriptional regulator [Actinoplanes nipponensis]
MSTTTAELGLRERKKAATRQALHEAAVRLAIAHGADKITVEAVADEAGVSRRTFSNYFANKEEALLYGDHQRISALIGMVRARPTGERPWEALTEAAREFYRQVGRLDPAWVAQTRLLRSQPALLAQQLNTFAAVERELAAAVTARMTEPDPSGVRAKLAAATFMASLRVALHIWLDAPADTSLAELVDRALAEAGRGFA